MKEWTEFLKKLRTVQRHSDHLHLGSEQNNAFSTYPDGHPGLRVAQTPHLDLGAQRFPAAADRKLPAARDQGQIHQDQICNPVADADAAVRVLRQPAAVHRGALPPLSSKTTSATTGIFRYRCRSTSGRNRTAAASSGLVTGEIRPRHSQIPPLAKGDFYKPGCRCKSTSGRSKDGCGIARSIVTGEIRPRPCHSHKKQKGTTCSVVPLNSVTLPRRRANSLRAVSESTTTTPARIAVSFHHQPSCAREQREPVFPAAQIRHPDFGRSHQKRAACRAS